MFWLFVGMHYVQKKLIKKIKSYFYVLAMFHFSARLSIVLLGFLEEKWKT